jgi:hypothetical protein
LEIKSVKIKKFLVGFWQGLLIGLGWCGFSWIVGWESEAKRRFVGKNIYSEQLQFSRQKRDFFKNW